MKKKKYGKCHLCCENKELTKEHIPPKRAFNNEKIFTYFGEQLITTIKKKYPWDLDGLKKTQHQNGVSYYTLCKNCNNNTGSWYANDYIDFIYKIAREILKRDNLVSNTNIELKVEDIYPLRIIKQILCMFLSVNPIDFCEEQKYLRNFILSKEKTGIDKKKISANLYVLNGEFGRYVGNAQHVSYDLSLQWMSEVPSPPLSNVLFLEQKRFFNIYCNITDFANLFSYEDKKTLTLKLPVYESNSMFPSEHTTKEKYKEMLKNKK